MRRRRGCSSLLFALYTGNEIPEILLNLPSKYAVGGFCSALLLEVEREANSALLLYPSERGIAFIGDIKYHVRGFYY